MREQVISTLGHQERIVVPRRPGAISHSTGLPLSKQFVAPRPVVLWNRPIGTSSGCASDAERMLIGRPKFAELPVQQPDEGFRVGDNRKNRSKAPVSNPADTPRSYRELIE